MAVKQFVNQVLSALGYVIVRQETLGQIKDAASRPPAAPPAEPVRPAEPVQPAETKPSANLKLKPSLNEPPQNCTLLAPTFVAEEANLRLASNIREFQRDGITTLPTDPERAAAWRETESFDRNVGNRHSSWSWAGNSVEPYSSTLKSGLPSDALRSELKALFSSEDFDAFFRGALGCPVTIGNCRLVKSMPHKSEGTGPQSWHQDGCPPGVIRGVLYLTDVDERTGPFQYRDGNGDEHTVLGNTGDLLVFDAMRLPHRAMPPEEKTRTAIDIVFMPRLANKELDVVLAGMNHWPADPFSFERPVERPEPAVN
ncbi:hypothetical protein [Bradyrhizobium sp. RT3a]|uniref:hypothetical protein n=1 Tax=unclassified Bradyrhizobium TaxID=2631580 RepID=UPI0033932E64